MPKFNWEETKKRITPEYKAAVETGTLRGESTAIMAEFFSVVHTIELNEKLFKLAEHKFRSVPHVKCHFGNSGELLSSIIREITTPAVFFLDAHWSGDATVNWRASAWKGYGTDTAYIGNSLTPQAQNPLLEEIASILALPYQCLICIDDLKNFGKDGKGLRDVSFQGEDWGHLSLDDVKATLGDRVNFWETTRQQLFISLKEAA